MNIWSNSLSSSETIVPAYDYQAENHSTVQPAVTIKATFKQNNNSAPFSLKSMNTNKESRSLCYIQAHVYIHF